MSKEALLASSAEQDQRAIRAATTNITIELHGEQRLVFNGGQRLGEITRDHAGGWVARRGYARHLFPSLPEAEAAVLRGCLGW